MNARFKVLICLLLSSVAFTAQARPLRLGVISDVNGSACKAGYPATSLKAFDELLTNHSVDHIIMPGDAVAGQCTSYAGSVPYPTVVKSMWADFDREFVRKAQRVENADVVLAPGNHDAPFTTAGGRDTFRWENEGFKKYWLGQKAGLDVDVVRVSGIADNYPYYWAYTYENVLFVVLQSTRTHTLSNPETQKRWLRAVLKSPEAKRARATIAFGHVPPYPILDPSVGSKVTEIIEKEQVGVPGSMMDLLLDNGVDLLVVGHSHAPYPAEVTRASDRRRIKILSMPCGHAPRKLNTKGTAAPRGYAIVEVDNANAIKLSIRNWSDGKAIPTSYFPNSIPQGAKVSYQRTKAYSTQLF